MVATTTTDNYKFRLPDFRDLGWHDDWTENFKSLDTLLANYVTIPSYQGAWQNNTAYTAGQRALDNDNSTIYECLVSHTSAATPTTFATDRTNNSTYWEATTLETTLLPVPTTIGGMLRLNDAGTSYIEGEILQTTSGTAVVLTLDGTTYDRFTLKDTTGNTLLNLVGSTSTLNCTPDLRGGTNQITLNAIGTGNVVISGIGDDSTNGYGVILRAFGAGQNIALFRAGGTTSAAMNYLVFESNVSGTAARIIGEGTDANQDIEINPAGTGTVVITGLPTSSAGLATGGLWNDSGTLKVA